MNQDPQQIDLELFKKFQELPILPFYKAVRIDDQDLRLAKKKFIQNNVLPIFTYSRANKISIPNYQKALEKLEAFLLTYNADQKILQLYKQKLEELRTRANLIEAIQNKDDQVVTELSKILFGTPKQTPEELETEFKEMMQHAHTFHQHSLVVDSELFIKMAQTMLDYYGMNTWRIKPTVRRKISIGHGFHSKDPIIRIPKKMLISKARAARLLTHEIEVHALRTFNGSQSTFTLLERGLDNYIATEEGLAVYFQSQVNNHVHQHAPGFWDAWTSVLTQHHDFKTTFKVITDARTELARAKGEKKPISSGRDDAWRLCLRSYRGISNLSQPGVGFLRDHIYRSGNLLVKQAINKEGPALIQTLFTGNLGLKHVAVIEKMNLPKGRTPELISKHIVKEILKKKN